MNKIFNAASSAQLIGNLLVGSSHLHLPYPNFLKEIVRRGDVDDFPKLEEFWLGEIPNLSVQDDRSAEYFLFICEQALLYHFYRPHADAFFQTLEVTRHRLVALKSNKLLNLDFEGFESFLHLIEGAFHRQMKYISIESFEEKYLNRLDWAVLDPSSIGMTSSLIGYVYLNEHQSEQINKSRLWFMKAIQEGGAVENIASTVFMAQYFLTQGSPDAQAQIQRLLQQVTASCAGESDKHLKNLLQGLAFLLDAYLLGFDSQKYNDSQGQTDAYLQRVRDFEAGINREKSIPFCIQLQLGSLIGEHYAKLYPLCDEELEKAGCAKRAAQKIEQVLQLAEQGLDECTILGYRLQKADVALAIDASLTEKEIKEILSFYKKNNDYQQYINTLRTYLHLLERNDSGAKAMDLLQDAFKLGAKKEEQGGFFLILSTFQLANQVFLEEIKKPGISWIIASLVDFFAFVQEASERLEEQMELIGKHQIEEFRETYLNFEPVSHFNIKVYYRYQFLEIKLMRIGALVNNDKISLQMADRLLSELADENNPINFIKADWEDFKDIPNEVRNKTLNKCINISKGDLPLAAEHLDFSYRNLRSYITFKEVNRLGFFLDMQLTSNRQLEQGIRYMFFDLYKKGTIFEVVFDMPKFLVNHAQEGFFSSDLEEELDIKGTTAKKYIKIMIDIGLIRQDKNAGRKHYYRLETDNVMKRLGKDQATLIR